MSAPESGWTEKEESSDSQDVDSSSESRITGSNNECIDIFCRFRPSKNPAKSLCKIDKGTGKVEILVPKEEGGYVNNQREVHEFQFNSVFDLSATQADVFDAVAKSIVMSVLDGFNGTIFAYGQTGSGKTFCITGGTDQYEQRGIIPRTLSLIFDEVAKRTNQQISIRISYLEIYNDNGYDLLDPSHETKKLDELPKVTLNQDDSGSVRLRNLGELPCNNADEALNLLFVGDTNRIICETPSNDASSRSHCIFTVNIESRQTGGTKIRRSKLHLVDLAGSERVKKTEVKGKILNEARYINLSLHYLEQVIVALHQRNSSRRMHIPYRNSMLTSVLRDSLGGNCKTVMLATMSMEEKHLDETISTARFAQRVALIRNDIYVNEEVDPKQLVNKLKIQIRELREEVAAARGSALPPAPLTDEDRERCTQLVRDFVSGIGDSDATEADAKTSNGSNGKTNEPGGVLRAVFANANKVAFCFETLRDMVLAQPPNGVGDGAVRNGKLIEEEKVAFRDEIKRLRLQVQSRDNEIEILKSFVKGQSEGVVSKDAKLNAIFAGKPLPSAAVMKGVEDGAARLQQSVQPGPLTSSDKQDLVDRGTAFEAFRTSYKGRAAIEESLEQLKGRMNRARQLGESVNATRANINQLKAAVEQKRLARGLQAIAEGGTPTDEQEAIPATEEELSLISQMEASKKTYRDSFLALKSLRGEIESIQHMYEKQRHQLQKEFDTWFGEEQKKVVSNASSASPRIPPASLNTASPVAALPPPPNITQRFGLGSAASKNSPAQDGTSPSAATTVAGGRNGASSVTMASRAIAMASAARRSSWQGPAGSKESPGAGPADQPQSTKAVFASTGNEKADAEIAAFFQIRDEIRRGSPQPNK